MQTFDDRGRPIHLEKLPHRSYLRAESPPRRFSTLQLQRLRRIEVRNFFVVMVAIGAYLVLCLVGIGWLRAQFGVPTPFLSLAISIVPMLLGLWWSANRLDRIYALHHLPALLICPACGHSLRGLSPEPDGCTACPECGAAWRAAPSPDNTTSPS